MRFYFAILISIAIHLLLNLGLMWAPVPKATKDAAVIEVELPDSNKAKQNGHQKQIVREATLPDQLKRMDDESLARFLSAQKQRVKQETRAEENGMTVNRAATTAAQTSESKTKTDQEKKTDKKSAKTETSQDKKTEDVRDNLAAKDYADSDVTVTDPKKKRKNVEPPLADATSPEFAQATQRGRSTVGESLPEEMSIGSFTALNTDRFTYYTFYARVEELVRFRWESKVRQALQSFDRAQQADQIRGRNWVTQYEFWIEPSGRLHSVHLLKESGVRKFDYAAEFAFRDAQLFPNPPKDLIDDDGFIKLRYTFNVHWSGN